MPIKVLIQLFFQSRSTGCTFYELITFEVFYDTNHIYEYESYLYELNKLLELYYIISNIMK